jgi:hypothetical protein
MYLVPSKLAKVKKQVIEPNDQAVNSPQTRSQSSSAPKKDSATAMATNKNPGEI